MAAPATTGEPAERPLPPSPSTLESVASLPLLPPAHAPEAAVPAPMGPGAPPATAKVPSAAWPPGRCFAQDCASCTSQPGCAWCGHPRGCLPSGERASCANINAWIDRTVWCGSEGRGGDTSGLSPVDAPRPGWLESVTSIEWPVRRGLCYELVVRLGPGARLDRSVLYGRMRDPVQDTGGPTVVVFGATRPVFGEGACARGPGTFTLKVKDVYDNFVSPLRGRGPFEAQLFARPIAEAELRAREREQDERYRRGICKACRQEYAACFFHGDTGCDAQLADCLRGAGISADQCR